MHMGWLLSIFYVSSLWQAAMLSASLVEVAIAPLGVVIPIRRRPSDRVWELLAINLLEQMLQTLDCEDRLPDAGVIKLLHRSEESLVPPRHTEEQPPHNRDGEGRNHVREHLEITQVEPMPCMQQVSTCTRTTCG